MYYGAVSGAAEQNNTVHGCPPVAEEPPSVYFCTPQNQKPTL